MLERGLHQPAVRNLVVLQLLLRPCPRGSQSTCGNAQRKEEKNNVLRIDNKRRTKSSQVCMKACPSLQIRLLQTVPGFAGQDIVPLKDKAEYQERNRHTML